MDKLIGDWLMVWVTIEPFSTLALFVSITANMTAQERRKTALKAVVYSTIILLAAIIVGQIILSAMNIRLVSFQIAGGIILFLFGLQMIFGMSANVTAYQAEKNHDIAVFPLAIPSLVGPEAIMAVIVLTDNHLYPVATQAATGFAVVTVLAITYVMLILSDPILRVIGRNGAAILERIMGMVLTALSVELVMSGLGISQWVAENY